MEMRLDEGWGVLSGVEDIQSIVKMEFVWSVDVDKFHWRSSQMEVSPDTVCAILQPHQVMKEYLKASLRPFWPGLSENKNILNIL